MGEYIFRDLLARRGLAERFSVASAGISGEEEGNPVYPPARAELARHGIGCAGKRAVRYAAADYARYDYILAMESWHVRELLRISADKEGKVYRLLDFTDAPGDIADPWYTRDFAEAYREIERGCEGFLAYLDKEGALF